MTLVANLLEFGRVLRRAGLEVHHGRLIDAIRSLEWIGVERRADVRATLRTLLVHRHDDLGRFDALFDEFFRSHAPASTGLELFSLGERPRVTARAVAGPPPSVDLEQAATDDADTTITRPTSTRTVVVVIWHATTPGMARIRDSTRRASSDAMTTRRYWRHLARSAMPWMKVPASAPTTVPLIRMNWRSRPSSSSSLFDVSSASHRAPAAPSSATMTVIPPRRRTRRIGLPGDQS